MTNGDYFYYRTKYLSNNLVTGHFKDILAPVFESIEWSGKYQTFSGNWAYGFLILTVLWSVSFRRELKN